MPFYNRICGNGYHPSELLKFFNSHLIIGRRCYQRQISTGCSHLNHNNYEKLIMKKQRCLLHCVLAIITFAAGGLAARGQIALTNYNAAKPLKIMPLSDSITDDCVVNGSWRKPLQPLLEANGFPFTFVGRNTSTAATGFTKLKHEGHCGAVVAAPGILSDGRYTAALNYLQYIAPQAFTSAIPDVMLILIGANDIGNGRNP
jgi:hypothetical protein